MLSKAKDALDLSMNNIAKGNTRTKDEGNFFPISKFRKCLLVMFMVGYVFEVRVYAV
jgi:hypothetical protein